MLSKFSSINVFNVTEIAIFSIWPANNGFIRNNDLQYTQWRTTIERMPWIQVQCDCGGMVQWFRAHFSMALTMISIQSICYSCNIHLVCVVQAILKTFSHLPAACLKPSQTLSSLKMRLISWNSIPYLWLKVECLNGLNSKFIFFLMIWLPWNHVCINYKLHRLEYFDYENTCEWTKQDSIPYASLASNICSSIYFSRSTMLI